MSSRKFDFTSLINIGPAIGKNLEDIGLKDLEDMKKVGTEEIFFRHFQQQGGWGQGMCSCWLYTIEGTITNTKWHQIPQKRKDELKKYTKDLRESFQPSK